MIPIVIASIAFLSLSRSLKNFIPQPFENAAARYRNGMAEGNTFVPQSSIDMMNSMGKKLAKTAVNLITVESLLKSNMHAAFSDDLIDDELVDLNIKEPAVTDTCFLDISVGGSNRTRRIEVGIYGEFILN